MAIEVSSLAIEVKSSGIAEGSKALDNLVKQADLADAKVSALTKSSMALSQTLSAGVSAIATLNKNYLQLNSALSASGQSISMASQSSSQLNASIQNVAASVSSMQVSMTAMNSTLNSIASSSKEAVTSLNNLAKVTDEAANAKQKASNHGTILNNTLKSMFVAASAYLGLNFVKGVIDLADAWGQMGSKLKIATGTMEGAATVQQNLYEVAQRLRIPLADSVQLFNRMTVPLMNMGRSTGDTVKVVEGMGMALKLSGATAQEASSVMLQFSQSMNSGRLNGAEFNAVAEGAPLILRAVEAELRRTGMGAELATKGLKKMASEGSLSSELLANAILNAREGMEKDFNSLPLTFDGAMQRIKNAWEKAVGEVAKNTKFNESIAKLITDLETSLPAFASKVGSALSLIAENFNNIVEAIKLVGVIAGSALAGTAVAAVMSFVTAITTAGTGVQALGVALGAVGLNPFTAAFAAAGVAIYAAYGYYKDFTKQTEEAKKKQEEFAGIIPSVMNALDGQIGSLKKQVDLLRERNGLEKKYIDDQGKLKGSVTLDDEQKLLLKLQQEKDQLSILEAKRESYKKQFGSSYYYQGNSEIELQKKMISELEAKAAPVKAKIAEINRLEAEKAAQSEKAKRNDIGNQISDVVKSKDDKEAEKLQKLLDKAKEFNRTHKDEQISLEEINKLQAKINELRADPKPLASTRVQLDYLDKAKAASAEALAKIKELQAAMAGEGDGKRTASEKAILDLEARRAALMKMSSEELRSRNIDKQSELQLINKAIAERQVAAQYEDSANALAVLNNLKNEANKQAATSANEAEKEAEKMRKTAESVGKTADEFARLSYEKAKAELAEAQAFGSAGFEGKLAALQKEVDARKQIWEYTKSEIEAKNREKVKQQVAGGGFGELTTDAKKYYLGKQQKEEMTAAENIDVTKDPVINTEQKKLDLLKQMRLKHDEEMAAIDAARVQVQLTSAESIAGSLASIAANTAGKQSGIYKAMFAVQKAFAIAKAMMDIQMAVSSASWSLPFPANLGAMATVAASGASIVSNIMSMGFKKGGYTGDYGTSEVAGVVHGQEFVVNAEGTAKHRALLEAINRGQDPSMIDNVINMPPPTVMSSGGGGMKVKIDNYGTDIRTEQISPNEVRIIARQEARNAVRKETGNVVSAAIAHPNSNVSKALGRNTQTQRRRN